MKIRAGRLRRTLLAALVVGAVVVPVSAAARPQVPAPAPAAVPPLSAATLDTAYDANRANAAEAAGMAERYGDRGRAQRLRAMASPERNFLSFDGRGAGRTAEVLGDLAAAERVAVLVPGSDTGIDTYGRFRAGAVALHERLGPRTAVVAWLGYETPGTVSPAVLTTGRAEEAAPELRSFVGELRGVNPGARLSLLCHSYGSVVCGRAAAQGPKGLDVADIALYGSPGVGVDRAADLKSRTHTRIWAGRGGDDWISDVPHSSVGLFGTTVGFGTDPVSPGFGARVFPAGGGGHSDYLKPGSVALDSLARIVRGQSPEGASHA
ncbi:alpha/beta hydrolase [Streptomyces sp. NPDC086554]|uniref:alpha/beta hydrolase n=1 Tax=Streptomyces sp. NPDC086554 TaxID=3154864 RepID=UPI00343B80FC